MPSLRSILVLPLAAVGLLPASARAQRAADALGAEIDRRAAAVLPRVVAWRRDIHEHPELSNREVRTGKLVADHLRSLGLEVRSEVARTGVVGVLRGGRPGPVVALRADMDALPVTEEVDLPFRSRVRAQYNGQEVGVMHACGHDNHVAILMGVAEVLAGMRERVPGTVKFIFQPAEEGPPAGEEGGASLMIKQGVLENPRPEAIFGLHVFPFPVGQVTYRPGGIMASGDNLRIVVRGRQTHGALPWEGVDPIVVAAQVVTGLQTVISRQSPITVGPAIITIGSIQGGVRNNIIPDSVVMLGTIRTFDARMQDEIHARVKRTAEGIAAASGATAEVRITRVNPVTFNDSALTARMTPTLARVLGDSAVTTAPLTTTAEDFAFYQQVIPGMFFFLGVTPPDADPKTVAPNHSPRFFADERALPAGVRAMAHLAVDYLRGAATRRTAVP
ncbi:MAG TPA: amidohydrolase [Gemmatimonadaceae bacterium]|nr:amidohydrolase [Gemmatimonadaceae bacterium]